MGRPCDLGDACSSVDAKSEKIDDEVSDDAFMTFDNGSTYYRVADVEQMIDDLAPEPLMAISVCIYR